jgi:hypothetical protein
MEITFSDLTLVLFLFIVAWLVSEISGGTGGGHRARVPVRSRP